jgi:hypothetical protein
MGAGAGPADEERIELHVGGIQLGDLVGLLYELERGPQPLRLERLHLRRAAPEPVAGVQRGATLEITAVVARRRDSG